MAVKLRILYSGGLASGSTGTVTSLDYLATKAWLIKNISFYNGNGAGIDLDLYVNQGAGANTYIYKGYTVPANGSLLVDHEITLNHDGTVDKISARCVNTSGYTLTCVVTGIERDQDFI